MYVHSILQERFCKSCGRNDNAVMYESKKYFLILKFCYTFICYTFLFLLEFNLSHENNILITNKLKINLKF